MSDVREAVVKSIAQKTKTAKAAKRKLGRYGKDELNLKLSEIRLHIAQGKSDQQIAEEMSLSAASFIKLKTEFYRRETESLHNATAEDVYIDYALKQGACIRDLDEMLESFKTTRQYNAVVGAVRAKSDIIDRVYKMGQDMGILAKAPEKKMVLHGVAVANLGNAQLRAMIAGELEGLAAISQQYGDKDLFGRPLSSDDTPMTVIPAALPPPPLFDADGKPGGATSIGRAAAARAKARVIRQKARMPPPIESG